MQITKNKSLCISLSRKWENRDPLATKKISEDKSLCISLSRKGEVPIKPIYFFYFCNFFNNLKPKSASRKTREPTGSRFASGWRIDPVSSKGQACIGKELNRLDPDFHRDGIILSLNFDINRLSVIKLKKVHK
jgi:hypothetical protein